MTALKVGTPVVVTTTGRSGAIFKVFKDWLGVDNHAYLIKMRGGRTPHMHDKFVRSQFELLPLALARAIKTKWRVGKPDCHWDEHDFTDVDESELADFIKGFMTGR